jgi:ribosomal protein S27AE
MSMSDFFKKYNNNVANQLAKIDAERAKFENPGPAFCSRSSAMSSGGNLQKCPKCGEVSLMWEYFEGFDGDIGEVELCARYSCDYHKDIFSTWAPVPF